MQIKNLFRKNFPKSYVDFFFSDFMNTYNKKNPEKFNQEIKNKIFLLSYMYEAYEKQIDSKIISYIEKNIKSHKENNLQLKKIIKLL